MALADDDPPNEWPVAEEKLTFEEMADVIGALFTSTLNQLREAFVPAYEALEPLIETKLGHHAVCEHKVKCKPPPNYAKITPTVTKSRRKTDSYR